MQLSLFDPQAPDAATFPSRPQSAASEAVLTKSDRARLATLQQKVEALMRDGAWRTLAQISAACGGSEASVSARLRQAADFGGTF